MIPIVYMRYNKSGADKFESYNVMHILKMCDSLFLE